MNPAPPVTSTFTRPVSQMEARLAGLALSPDQARVGALLGPQPGPAAEPEIADEDPVRPCLQRSSRVKMLSPARADLHLAGARSETPGADSGLGEPLGDERELICGKRRLGPA